jgi:hypothetical protein
VGTGAQWKAMVSLFLDTWLMPLKKYKQPGTGGSRLLPLATWEAEIRRVMV